MTKNDFLISLGKALSALPKDEVDEHLEYYSEMIDDRIEDELSEEEAVLSVGDVNEIAAHILSERPVTEDEKTPPKKRLSALAIVLIVLGSPIWLSLIAAGFAVAVAVFATLWSVVVSLWAAAASLVGGALGGIFGGICIFSGNAPSGFAMIGMGIACVGLAILFFWGCKAATRGMYVLTEKTVLGIIGLFRKKEAV